MPGSFPAGNTVAELFASLGLDTTGFSKDLRQSRLDMAAAAQGMAADVRIISDAFSKLGEGTFGTIRARMQQAAQEVRILNSDLANGARMAADHARMEEGFARDRVANQRAYERDRARAANIRRADIDTEIRLQADLEKQQARMAETAGGFGMAGRIAARIGIYMAIYGAARLASDAMQRVLDIERQSTQTGFSVEGTQRLQFAAAGTGTPIESVTGAINRLQSNIESMRPASISALQGVGIAFSDLKARIERDPESAVKSLIMAINGLDSEAKKAQAFQELFGTGRGGGRIQAALTAYADGVKAGTILTRQELDAISGIASWWETAKLRAEAYFAMMASHAVSSQGEGRTTRPGGLGSTFPQGSTERVVGNQIDEQLAQMMGQVNIPPRLAALGRDLSLRLPTPFSGPNISVDQSGRDKGIDRQGEAKLFELADAERALERAHQEIVEKQRARTEIVDMFGSPGLRNLERLREQRDKAIQLQREGFMTEMELSRVKEGYIKRVQEEILKALEEELAKTTSLMSAFGVSGRSNLEQVRLRFNELIQAFRDGKVGMDDLREATASYYQMIEEQAARPGLKAAIKMFEQGMLSDEGLLRARRRAGLLDERSQAEQAFEKGEIGPDELRRAQERYRLQLQDMQGNKGSRGWSPLERLHVPGSPIFRSNQGGIPPGYLSDLTPQKPQASLGGGTINLVALDQFSESMVRRWKQQGLLSG